MVQGKVLILLQGMNQMDMVVSMFILPIALIGLAGTVFWIWMLVDCLMNESSEGNDKIIWAVVILATNLLGAALYFFIRRPVRIQDLGR